ncbi:hypothetical protein M0R45_019472 [Rubus argutus]|uniref:Uncharacterized protein n=1 Tax=Rubus argutus TaxID=59490 RepID=A0AAW1X7G5_RUBAR
MRQSPHLQRHRKPSSCSSQDTPTRASVSVDPIPTPRRSHLHRDIPAATEIAPPRAQTHIASSSGPARASLPSHAASYPSCPFLSTMKQSQK